MKRRSSCRNPGFIIVTGLQEQLFTQGSIVALQRMMLFPESVVRQGQSAESIEGDRHELTIDGDVGFQADLALLELEILRSEHVDQ
jgi:hypothetical protein